MMNVQNPTSRCRFAAAAALYACALSSGWVAIGSCRGAPEGFLNNCDSSVGIPPGVFTDILFVVDNSSSMREEQERVVQQLSAFVQALSTSPVEHDFQVGVITTGVSARFNDCGGNLHTKSYPEESGRLQRGKTGPDCVVTDPSSATLVASDDPQIVAKFSDMIFQGTCGSGQEMGLEAMRRALSAPAINSESNAGFLRPGARLLVVIVSDEDDCSDPGGDQLTLQSVCGDAFACNDDTDCRQSEHQLCLPAPLGSNISRRVCTRNECEVPQGRSQLESVQSYVDFLADLDDGTGRNRKREVYLAVIGAVDPNNPTQPHRCSDGGTEAFGSAVRYVEAVNLMGDRGFVDSICRSSYQSTLQKIAKLVTAPQVLTLGDAPSDGRLLQIEITRTDGTTESCTVGKGFTYEPPVGSSPARATLVDQCRLEHGDQVRIFVFCAG